MVYRIPMSNILGEEGNGIYAVAFEIYDLILIISSYSLPLGLLQIVMIPLHEQITGGHAHNGIDYLLNNL